MTDRTLDIVVHGATGFTGRLVAEALARRGPQERLSFGLSGRDPARLAERRDALGLPSDTPLIVADAADPASLAALARAARVVLTTVGPYQLYGSGLVAACAAAGTGYVDLCGEPAWMRLMIDAHDAEAKASGARIVLSCGFDSIPFDLGVLVLQEAAMARFGAPCRRVKGRVRSMKGTFSGGTAASLKATMAAAAGDPRVMAWLRDPFALTPGFAGPPQPTGARPLHDEALGSWCAPFIMAPINTKNVHRSNLLMAHAYGADFVYDEMLLTGPGPKGEAIANAVAADRSMMGDDTPKPGEGPSKADRDAGRYDLLFVGEAAEGRTIRVGVKGDADPGYGSTSKMIAEAAIALARGETTGGPGLLTPAAAFGSALVGRLSAHAGVTFAVEE